MDSDTFFWKTGLSVGDKPYYYLNGVRHAVPSSQYEASIVQALHLSVQPIQEHTYYGRINNHNSAFDVLMTQAGVVKTLSTKYSTSTSEVLPLNDVGTLV